MHIVSVINYKGGVGKTTLTANLGGELAARGFKMLLVDLDPQASLTFSLVTPDLWRRDLADARTIKNWYDSFSDGSPANLADYVMRPRRITSRLSQFRNSGKLGLIPSHLGLINVDTELASELGGTSLKQAKLKYLRVHRRLADALSASEFQDWDLVLIDCPPNFNIVTKNAIVASDKVLIPAKADYLSTLGIDYLISSLDSLVSEYNEFATLESPDVSASIDPEVLGVVFTMIQYYDGQPISRLRPYIEQTRQLGVHVFAGMFRENKSHFGDDPQTGIPLVLGQSTGNREMLIGEVEDFVTEFVTTMGL